MEHTHADPHLHVTTCDRCRREWEVRQACDPLTVEADPPPVVRLPWWSHLVPVRLRAAVRMLLWRIRR